jgi:hypothetical protein
MERFDDDTLFAELRAMRPTPRPEFAAELDERAAAGFPRGADTTASVIAPIADWWRGMSVRGRLVPALAAVAVVLIAATAAVAISQSGGGSGGSEDAVLGMTAGPRESGVTAEESAGGESGGAVGAPAHQSGGANGGSRHGRSGPSSEMTYETEVPSVESAPEASAKAGGVMGDAAPVEEAESAEAESGSVEEEPEESGKAPKENAPFAAGLNQRDVERSSYIVLGTKPGGVPAAAAKVYAAVHAAHGIVLHSSVQSGSKGATGATFSLLIPSRKVDDALGEISAIAEVRERHDATNDITAPTVGAAEELADSNAAIESLLKQLGDAETESEQESIEARLREERGRHAAIRASLDHLHERAAMSEVSVRIVTGHGAGAVPPSKGSGGGEGWGVGDALGDAGHILTIAAGVILIGLAILGPFAILAILLWGGNRFRVRRLRERTLG